MAKVHNWNARGIQKRRAGLDEPTQHVESEGDRLIKQLVEKQLNTHLSLEEQLQFKREFERRLEVGALSCGAAPGQTTWKQFQDWERQAELRSRGFSDDEVALLHDSKRRKLEQQVAEEQLANIRRRLELQTDTGHQGDSADIHGSSGRHERELAAAVKPESQETRLYQFAVACRPPSEDPRPPNHPIHNLKALEQRLFQHLTLNESTPCTGKVIRSTAPVKDSPCSCGDAARNTASGWDVKCRKHAARSKPASGRVYSCKPKELYTVANGKIVALDQTPTPRDTTTEEVGCQGETFVVTDSSSFPAADPGLLEGRLNVEEIRRLPRFTDYSPGEPSQVLYVKNLHKTTKEEDLVALFGCYEDDGGPKLKYRLMTGRMRGQAFVTFPSMETAAEALTRTNGVLWRGQPLVIQFGRPPPT